MWKLNWTELGIDWDRLKDVLTYDASQPMIFSSGFFLLLFLGFSLIYLILQKKTTARLLFVTLFSYYFYYKSSGFYFFSTGYCHGVRLSVSSHDGADCTALETETAGGMQFVHQPRIALLFQVHQFFL